jgi:mannose-6-phosphate isomerase-like protein (cupin superfamily)
MIVKDKKEITSFLAGDHTQIQEILHPKNDPVDLNYSLALATLEPGKRSLPHILHKSSELYLITKGKGRVFVGGQQQEVGEGQVVLIPQGVEQWIENIGDTPLEFYCVVSPPWSEEQEEIKE